MAIVSLGARDLFQTEISDEDYSAVTRWRWHWKRSKRQNNGGIYAKRNTTIDGRRVTILLSHFILIHCMGQPRPSSEHDADHMDGNTLNDRRDNLQWLLKGPNRSCTTRHWAGPAVDSPQNP